MFSNTCSYSISYASDALTFSPAISSIETCIVTVNLFDGINNVKIPINIVTTNTISKYPLNIQFNSLLD